MRQERLGNTILWRDGDGVLRERKLAASEWFTRRAEPLRVMQPQRRHRTPSPPAHRLAALPLIERSVCQSVFRHIEPKDQWELLEYYEKVTKAP